MTNQPQLRTFIRKTEVAQAIGKSTRTVDRMVQSQDLPAPVMNKGFPVWDKQEIADWQQAKIDARDQSEAA